MKTADFRAELVAIAQREQQASPGYYPQGFPRFYTNPPRLIWDPWVVHCMVRGSDYHDGFADEFTVQCTVEDSRKPMFDRIVGGEGTHLLYAFQAENDPAHIGQWVLVNLDIFRQAIQDDQVPLFAEDNGDGTEFYPFRTDLFSADFIVARGGN